MKQLLILLLSLIPSSCVSFTWRQDYYSHSQGAYINGIEYHMTGYGLIGGRTNFDDFYVGGRDSLLLVAGRHRNGGMSSDPNGEQQYRFDFLIITDTVSFYKGAEFSFFDQGGKLADYEYQFSRVQEPYTGPKELVMATVYDLSGKKLFRAKEGIFVLYNILQPEMERYVRSVRFEFIAESNDGEVLIVEKGYINQ